MKYDNLADARTKLQGTMVYFDGKAMYCREVNEYESKTVPNLMEIKLLLSPLTNVNARGTRELLTDPRLGYMAFNIGYINFKGYATWFYRMPYRQYRQGLRGDQVEFRDESGMFRMNQEGYQQHQMLGANESTGLMMEDKYPTIEDAVKTLDDGSAVKVAFHKDFAIYRDKLHQSVVLEHKGVPTAYADLNMVFKCAPELKYLRESIMDLKLKVA